MRQEYEDEKMTLGEKTDVYTCSEVAEIMGVTDQTVLGWCEKGKFSDAYKTEDGNWHFPKNKFKITLEQARERKKFDGKINLFNKMMGKGTQE